MLKLCKGCSRDLDIGAFELYPERKWGRLYRRHECKECRALKRRARAASASPEQKEARRERYREYTRANRERKREYARNQYAKDKEKHRLYKITQYYGLTPEQYKGMIQDQKGLCAICGLPPSGKYPLCVDHDHRTGQVRSLLCSECNNGIGKLRDDPLVVRAALDYLLRWKEEGIDEQKQATRNRTRSKSGSESDGEGASRKKTASKRGTA